MRKKTILTSGLVFLLLFTWASADEKEGGTKEKTTKTETELVGKITDILSGEELAGVRVQLDGTGLVTYTGFKGEFRFSGLKPGTYTLVTSMISYRSNRIKVELVQSEKSLSGMVIRMKPE